MAQRTFTLLRMLFQKYSSLLCNGKQILFYFFCFSDLLIVICLSGLIGMISMYQFIDVCSIIE